MCKSDLEDEIERTTVIRKEPLRLEQLLSDLNITHRLSWATVWKTTRMKDETCSLLTSFDLRCPC